jgi:phosphatidylethanolamine/phosphatidyl-N-methylethanolamine N-methyltransferase
LTEHGQTYWNRIAKNYDRSMVLLGGPIPRMVSLAAEAVNGAERVLEVAAGTGLVTVALARAAREVVATDYAPEMVALLERRVRQAHLENVRCEPADIYSLPFSPASFDAVVAANVLHLVPDLAGALSSLRRQVKPGGRLIVPTFCHGQTLLARLISRALALSGFPGERRFRLVTLVSAVEAAGLQVTRADVIPGPIPIGFVEGCFT